jgi:hypothetical protein
MATIVTRAGKGSPLTHVEVDANFNNLNNDKAELASPTFTGTPAAPTATVGTNTTQIATTAFVNAEIANDITGKADLASPTFTGTPAAPTASVGTDTTQIATTAFVNAEIANDAPSKTGTGASGTWAISISGDAASVDGKSFGTFTAAGGVAYATDTSTLAATAAGTSGQVLQSNGASAPSWVAVPSPDALTTATGSAPSYSARAWVNYNGTNGAVRASANVTSVSRTATGNCTVNMTTAMTTANYSVQAACDSVSSTPNILSLTTTSFAINTRYASANTNQDKTIVTAAVFC